MEQSPNSPAVDTWHEQENWPEVFSGTEVGGLFVPAAECGLSGCETIICALGLIPKHSVL